MDETMKSLDDLLPPPEKPKRELPDRFTTTIRRLEEPQPEEKAPGGVSKEMRAEITQRIRWFRRRTWESDAVEFVREYYLSRLSAKWR